MVGVNCEDKPQLDRVAASLIVLQLGDRPAIGVGLRGPVAIAVGGKQHVNIGPGDIGQALVQGPFLEGRVLLHALHVVLRLLQGKLQLCTVILEIDEGRQDVHDGLASQEEHRIGARSSPAHSCY